MVVLIFVLFRFILLLIIVIFILVVLIGVLFRLLLILLPLDLILSLLHLLFASLGVLDIGHGLGSQLNVVRDQDIVEDGAGLNLPQIEAQSADLLAQVQFVVSHILGISDLGMLPGALVVRVVQLLRLPLALVFGVVDHWGLPLAVHLIVPVLRLGGIWVGDVLWLVPVLGFLIIGVGNGGLFLIIRLDTQTNKVS